MAEINYAYIDEKHTIDTYDNILNTYNWIHNALLLLYPNYEELLIVCKIEFSVDEISYKCKSIDEFKTYAFGKTIKMKSLFVYVLRNETEPLVDVFANYFENTNTQKFVLSSDNELHLTQLRDILQKHNNENYNQTKPIEMKIENNVTIGNNNQISNSIIGSKNRTKINLKNNSSNKECFASKILWQIIVPLAVGIMVGVVIYLLKMN